MPTIHVCPLSRLAETVSAQGARHVVTLVTPGIAVERPAGIAEADHLRLAVSDVAVATEGHVLAGSDHVAALVAFTRAWSREHPLVIHCYAGISRSTAAAFIAACALAPERDEADLATILRRASPSATPNIRLVALADEHLGRHGRMVAAIQGIGRGTEAFEGRPFVMDFASVA